MSEETAVKKAYDYLYNEILNGNLQLGAPISEAEVSRTIGLSRSPVREALKNMEAEGLVKRYPRKGVFVSDITDHDLEEIFELRIVLEGTALKSSIFRISADVLDEVEQKLLSLQENGGEPEEYYAVNSKVHNLIVSRCGNGRLCKILDMLAVQNAVVNRISSRNPSHFETSTKEHLEIVRALKEKNLPKAEECLLRHLETVRDSTIASYNHRIIR